MVFRISNDLRNRGMMRPLDRILMWGCPLLAVIGVVLGVLELTVRDNAVGALYQAFFVVAMVLCGMAARARLRRDAPLDEPQRS